MKSILKRSPFRQVHHTATLLVLTTLFIACAKDLPSEPDALRQKADALESQRDQMDRAHENWQSGDVMSSIAAYFGPNRIKLIEEHMTRGTSGHSINRYYFHRGALFCYREARTGADSTVVEIELFLDPDGKLLYGSQKRNNAPVELDAYIPSLVQKHAHTLKDLAKQAPRVN